MLKQTFPFSNKNRLIEKDLDTVWKYFVGASTHSTPPSATTPTLAKSARQMAESLLEAPGANGSFLDGIIRSSLESGVPPGSEQKSLAEEERSVANLSNKALLDQLCRNSRLTPLSTKVEGSSSSGDEGGRKSGCSPLNFTTGNIIVLC